MMYIHSNNEIDKRINVSKIANNIGLSTMSDNSTAAECNSRLVTVLVQHAHDYSRYRGIRIVSSPGNNTCIRNVPLSATTAKSKLGRIRPMFLYYRCYHYRSAAAGP